MSIASQPLPGAVATEEHNDVDHTSVSLAVSTVILALRPKENETHPTLWLPLNDEEMKVYDELYTALVTYTEEMLSKFILKQEPMSNWDAFQKGMTDMGVDRLLEVYTSAYNRVTGKN